MSDKVFDIQERCFNYSVSIVKLIEGLKLKSVYQPLIGQVFRSATSVGANVVEGQHSHSKREMVRYYRIALKSGNEAKYWLKILNVAFDEKESTEKLIVEINEITKILAAIIIKLSKKEE